MSYLQEGIILGSYYTVRIWLVRIVYVQDQPKGGEYREETSNFKASVRYGHV